LVKTLGTTKTEQLKQNFIADFKEGIYDFSKNRGVVWLVHDGSSFCTTDQARIHPSKAI
jgi:hypothetical protein